MSSWFFGRKKGGIRSLYSASFPITMVITLLVCLGITLVTALLRLIGD